LAVAFTWTGSAGSSFWSIAGNWSPNGIPSGNNDEAFIPSVSNSGPTNVTDNYNIFPTGLALLRVSRTGLGPYFSILTISADSLSASEEDVGYGAGALTARGEINQSEGANDINTANGLGFLTLAGESPDVGIYNLSGTGQLNIGTMGKAFVGALGAGSINQSGGTVDVADGAYVYIGTSAGSSGHYIQSGGFVNLTFSATIWEGYLSGSSGQYTLNGNGTITTSGTTTGGLFVGRAGTGTFDQSAGVATLTQVTLGFAAFSTGTYLLSGTGALNADVEDVGEDGAGTFNQNGGTNACATSVSLGAAVTGTGTYNLSGGNFTAVSSYIGGDGAGTFNQTGGMNSTVSIQLALSPGSSGIFNLSGGVMSAGSISVNANGTINFTGGSFMTGSLILNGGGKMLMGSANHLLLNTNSLSVDTAGGSKLDLADNAAIVDYSGASPLATIAGYIKTGYAGGSWTGNGITSSAAAAASSSAQQTAVGYAEASDLGVSTFWGQSVDPTSVLVRYTYSGDANLDGSVDTIDFNLVASHFSQSGAMWDTGDFDFNGTTDTIDFNLLVSNFSLSLPAEGNSRQAGAGSLAVLVPESRFIPAFAVTALALWACRRRHVVD